MGQLILTKIQSIISSVAVLIVGITLLVSILSGSLKAKFSTALKCEPHLQFSILFYNSALFSIKDFEFIRVVLSDSTGFELDSHFENHSGENKNSSSATLIE